MMQTKQVEEEFQGKLLWRGTLTQAMSMVLGAELINALEECDSLIVNLQEVQSLDPSFLVLFCTVKRQANEGGKAFFLEGLENPPVKNVIQKYRSHGSRICCVYCGNSCLFNAEFKVNR